MFLYGEFVHADIKDVASFIYYTPIKQKNIIHINCALGIFDDCPEYMINDVELYDEPNLPLVHFNLYTFQGGCEKRGYNSK